MTDTSHLPTLTDDQRSLIRDGASAAAPSGQKREMFARCVFDILAWQASDIPTNRDVILAINTVRRRWGAA